jgi:predicted type IV restriction endonuclease
MSAPEIIQQLVERFEKNRAAYLSGSYKEARLRGDFLDPFFEALGWDVHNRKNNPEDSREVIIEDTQKVRGR